MQRKTESNPDAGKDSHFLLFFKNVYILFFSFLVQYIDFLCLVAPGMLSYKPVSVSASSKQTTFVLRMYARRYATLYQLQQRDQYRSIG